MFSYGIMFLGEYSAMKKRPHALFSPYLMLGVAAVFAITSSAAAARTIPAYLRLAVPATAPAQPEVVLYLELTGKELRMADTIAGLKNAKPVKGITGRNNTIQFTGVALPIPPEKLEAGISAAKASLMFYNKSRLYGTLHLFQTDEHKAKWTYSTRFYLQAGTSPDTAATIQVPSLARAELKTDIKPGKGKMLGIGVKLMVGPTAPETGEKTSAPMQELSDIAKNGKSVNLSVRLLNATGKVVSSEQKPLANLGYG